MTDLTGLTLVPTATLAAMQADLAAIRARLDGATIVPPPEWVTVRDYAAAHGRTVRTVRNWIAAGRIETQQRGAITYVRNVG